MRDLATLPKAHLHLHFTGSMRLETLIELASSARTRLPSNFLDGDPLRVPADRRGWFRFQRAYDTARALVRTEEVMRRIVLEAALDDAAEGSRRLEIQVDPTSYAPFVGGITPALEIILDAAKQATTLSGVEVAVIVAASRMRHPLDARTLARLAVRYAGDQPGEVVGFGVLLALLVDGQDEEFEKVYQLNKSVKLPVSLEEIEISEQQWEESTNRIPHMSDVAHYPYAITKQMLTDAMRKLKERAGRENHE